MPLLQSNLGGGSWLSSPCRPKCPFIAVGTDNAAPIFTTVDCQDAIQTDTVTSSGQHFTVNMTLFCTTYQRHTVHCCLVIHPQVVSYHSHFDHFISGPGGSMTHVIATAFKLQKTQQQRKWLVIPTGLVELWKLLERFIIFKTKENKCRSLESLGNTDLCSHGHIAVHQTCQDHLFVIIVTCYMLFVLYKT